MEELKSDPALRASEIGVAVKNGIVELSGQLDAYSKKLAAERAAKRVLGVKAIAEDIRVGVSPANQKTDIEIAAAVVDRLKWHASLQEGQINIKVEDGVVRLDGEVEWEYQRSGAAAAIEHLVGIKSVLNLISVKPRSNASDIKKKIEAALLRSATVDSGRIAVETSGSKVVLRGTVRSIAEKNDAERAAWNAPGVAIVESKLVLEIPEYSLL